MPTKRFPRQFSSGSRPTPDPFDNFLDKEGFYRKHTARDSTCLFRVVSEQIYDTQSYHEQIRKDCVNFMIKHRDQYEQEIDDNFDKYIRKMAATDTYGTLTELRAMGYLFKRNVLLYQPYDLGVWLVDEPEYNKPFLRVFGTYEGHFDSVFTKSFVIKAGFCQSIVYETLYKNVFKLPDIEYSVEVMLHSTNDQESNIVFAQTEYENDDNYASHIVFEDGRKFQLDRPENTRCILNNPTLCHFHNMDFEMIAKELAKKSPTEQRHLNLFLKSSLTDKHTSCVRQLLNDGITPFPYKVAKALDPDMYRNIEFDSWADARKASRLKYGWNLQIGTKCLVCLDENQNELHKCYIQEIDEKNQSCIVYIDDLCEKRSMPIHCIRPLYVASYEPKRYHHYVVPYEKSDFEFNELIAFGKQRNEHINNSSTSVASLKSSNKNRFYSDYSYDPYGCEKSEYCDAICKKENLKQFTDLSNFQPYNSYDLIALPITYTPAATNMGAHSNNPNISIVKNAKNRNQPGQNHGPVQSIETKQVVKVEDDKGGNAKNVHDQNPNDGQSNQQQQHLVHHQPMNHQHHPLREQQQSVENVPVNPQPMTNTMYQGTQYFYPAYEFGDQNATEMIPNQQFYAIPPSSYQAPPVQGYAPANQMVAYNYVPVQYGNWPAYGTQGYVPPAPAQPIPYAVQSVPASVPLVRRDLLLSNGRVNYNANYSFSASADDLPINDKSTVRFFYNFGIEYFKHLQTLYGHNQLMSMIEGDNYEQAPSDVDSQHNDMTANLQQMNLDDNITTPTQPKNGNKQYHEYSARRSSSVKYNKRETRPHMNQQFQGTFSGPTKTFNRGGTKYYDYRSNNGRNNSYDSTPIKEGGHKQHYHNYNNSSKREPYNGGNEMTYNSHPFGCNVPPYPFNHGDQPIDHQFQGPPGNAFLRMTPPVPVRSSSVPVGVSPHEYMNEMHTTGHPNQYVYPTHHGQTPFVNAHVPPPPMHHQIPSLWMIPPPGNQVNLQPPNQAPLNTSNVSNMSSAGSNPSN